MLFNIHRGKRPAKQPREFDLALRRRKARQAARRPKAGVEALRRFLPQP